MDLTAMFLYFFGFGFHLSSRVRRDLRLGTRPRFAWAVARVITSLLWPLWIALAIVGAFIRARPRRPLSPHEFETFTAGRFAKQPTRSRWN